MDDPHSVSFEELLAALEWHRQTLMVALQTVDALCIVMRIENMDTLLAAKAKLEELAIVVNVKASETGRLV